MANIVDPFQQNKAIRASQLRDMANALRGAAAAQGQAKVNVANLELQQAQQNRANTRQDSRDAQQQVNALKRITAQGIETRRNQRSAIDLSDASDAKARASSQATFNQLIGKTVTRETLETPRDFATPPQKDIDPGIRQQQADSGKVEVTRAPQAVQATAGDLPSLQNQQTILEQQLQNALASPDEKAGRKAALFIDTKLTRVKKQINVLSSDAIFKRRKSQLSDALNVPEAAITPQNMTKFETQLVNTLTKGPEIPGSADVTMQFLVKFPEWQEKFTQMQEQGQTNIDLDSPEIQTFLDRNKRMFNTFADDFINKNEQEVDPITSKQATLYRSERDKLLKALGPLSELKGYIREIQAGAAENWVWDASVDASDSLQKILQPLGLSETIYDEDEVDVLIAAATQLQIETVNPLLRSVENVSLNSPTEVQALFVSELLERLQEAGVESDAIGQMVKNLGAE